MQFTIVMFLIFSDQLQSEHCTMKLFYGMLAVSTCNDLKFTT